MKIKGHEISLLYYLLHIDSIQSFGLCNDGKVHKLEYRKIGFVYLNGNRQYRYNNCGEMAAEAYDAEFRRCTKCGGKFPR